MMAAAVATAVAAAAMAFAVVVIVVIATNIGVEFQSACQKQSNCLVCIAPDTTVEFDAGLLECHLCAAANAAANQNICLHSLQQTCQCAVTTAHGVNNLGSNDLAIFHVIDLELGTVAKVLENKTVFVSNCDSHDE